MTKKIVIRLQGGLGNQMFQYAFAYNLSLILSSTLYIDTHLFYKRNNFKKFTKRNLELNIFNINYDFFIKYLPFHIHFDYYLYKFITFLKIKIYSYKILNEIDIINTTFSKYQNIYLIGYFQDYKYFTNHKIVQNIFNTFLFHEPLSDINKLILNKINSTQSVSIHVRRSDYLDKKNITVHGTCSLDYYKMSVSYFLENFKNVTFFIFSDDFNWVKVNLTKILPHFEIIDNNFGNNSYIDLYLMSKCKHNIIANSTFSWWGGWLNSNINKTVISPKLWFVNEKNINPIIPTNWIKL